MELLFNSIKAFFDQYGLNRTYWVAYSGGLDSTVLLHLCAKAREELSSIQLGAVHINHGLNPHAAKWSEQCEKYCRHLQIEFFQKTIHAKHALGDSPEDIARKKRYAVFAELLNQGDFLLTAHQQDDQAETLLVQLFRGAGPKGLASMPMIKSFADGFHARPLLNFTRDDLSHYATVHELQWIEDDSNKNTNLTRNFLRHHVVPLLKTRWPTVTKTLSRVAGHCADAAVIMEEVAKLDLKDHVTQCSIAQPAKITPILSVKRLNELTPLYQRQALRTWMSEMKFPLPSDLKLKQIQRDFLQARNDKAPHIQWGDVELRRYDHHLYLMKKLPPHDPTQIVHWKDLQEPLVLPHVGELRVIKNNFDGQRVTVRFRQGGEVCQLPKRKHHHELKKLFQIWKVPPWERDRIPLIYLNDVLTAVVGYWQDDAFFFLSNQMLNSV